MGKKKFAYLRRVRMLYNAFGVKIEIGCCWAPSQGPRGHQPKDTLENASWTLWKSLDTLENGHSGRQLDTLESTIRTRWNEHLGHTGKCNSDTLENFPECPIRGLRINFRHSFFFLLHHSFFFSFFYTMTTFPGEKN